MQIYNIKILKRVRLLVGDKSVSSLVLDLYHMQINLNEREAGSMLQTREQRAVLAAWERAQKLEKKGTEKQRRQELRESRKTMVWLHFWSFPERFPL